MEKVLILVIDGCAPAYLTPETAPEIFRLTAAEGFFKTVQGAMPSVTNVNHACILSGQQPNVTKITGNYYYDPQTGEEGFIEERGRMKAETILQHYRSNGGTTALLTVKGKILGVYGDGADIGISVQTPDAELLRHYGLPQPPAVASAAATPWILDAAGACIETDDPDFVYCTTNDYIFHHYAPGTAEARAQIKAIDERIARIAAEDPARQIYLTADHGMNQKTRIVDFRRVAREAGFEIYCLLPLKDRYIENHLYQESGMAYLFVKHREQLAALRTFAEAQPYVESVMTPAEAARAFHLPADQIGDLVLLATGDSAFGECGEPIVATQESRSHGSLHEREVPLAAVRPQQPAEAYRFSGDIVKYLLQQK